MKINQFSFDCLKFLWGIQVRMHLDLEFRRELRARGRALHAHSEVIEGNGPVHRGGMCRNEEGRSLNMELLQSSSIYGVCWAFLRGSGSKADTVY